MGRGIKVFYTLFIIIGIILIIISVYLFFDTKKAIKNSIETTGIFEKLDNVNGYIIKFNTESGEEIQSYSLYNNFIVKLNKKSEVSVFYNKDNPEDVRINSFMSEMKTISFKIWS